MVLDCVQGYQEECHRASNIEFQCRFNVVSDDQPPRFDSFLSEVTVSRESRESTVGTKDAFSVYPDIDDDVCSSGKIAPECMTVLLWKRQGRHLGASRYRG